MRVIDFRSDTVTQPTTRMREAMANAPVGDDVMGEDPTVNLLESMSANLMGKEAAVLVSSGTMGNLVSVLSQCQRGDEIIVGDKAHIYRAEARGASVLAGIAYHPLKNDKWGMLDPHLVNEAIQPNDSHYAKTTLVALENTHNLCGGVALTPTYLQTIARVAIKHNLQLHIDGARIFNAATYLNVPVTDLVKQADTVTFCLSKGLSAPVGSVVCGRKRTIEIARRWRKMLGGGMRQAGIIAAAGIVALETMIDRIADDHINGLKLATGLKQIPGISIDMETVQTNLVLLRVETPTNPDLLVKELANRGIKVIPRQPKWRLATHPGITSEDVDYSLNVFDDVFRTHLI